MADTAPRPFQPLHDRLAGKAIDHTLHDGVPDWLEAPLLDWLRGALGKGDALANRVLLRLHWTRGYRQTPAMTLLDTDSDDLLTVIDAVLQLHPGWEWPPAWGSRPHEDTLEDFEKVLDALENALDEGSSLYTIDRRGRRLVGKANATVREAAEAAIRSAPEMAADHLATAWGAAYGVNPDPDKAFHEAMRAVEEVACPLVQPQLTQSNKPTLGTVLGELGKTAPHKWELTLPDVNGAPAGADSIVAVMRTLWEAQVSRHGGSAKSRRQDVQEAQAAVHLAVLAVQWLSTGVLRKKP